MTFELLTYAADGPVVTITLNRPDRANALSEPMWRELRDAMHRLDAEPTARVGILAGAGRHFCAGIDLSMLGAMRARAEAAGSGAHGREALRRLVLDLQDTITAIERCRKPVIAAVQGACVGGGVDILTACDLRYCSADAFFSVKEVDLGLAADVGVLQRLPKIVGEGIARELAYTARRVSGTEAEAIRLVNRCLPDAAALADTVQALAAEIAAKSPLAIRGTKEMITYVRDHSVADGLNYVATWNAAVLISDDLDEALAAAKEGRTPRFAD